MTIQNNLLGQLLVVYNPQLQPNFHHHSSLVWVENQRKLLTNPILKNHFHQLGGIKLLHPEIMPPKRHPLNHQEWFSCQGARQYRQGGELVEDKVQVGKDRCIIISLRSSSSSFALRPAFVQRWGKCEGCAKKWLLFSMEDNLDFFFQS